MQVKRPRLSLCLGLIIALSCLTAGSAMAARAVVSDLRVGEQKGSLVVSVALSAEIRPKLFSMGGEGSNPRLVVDFPSCTASGLPASLKPKAAIARRIRVGIHSDKVRFVIDLKPGGDYLVEHWLKTVEKRYVLRVTDQ